MRQDQEIHFEVVGQTGRVTLDRPQALNALSHDMVRRLGAQLAAWRRDPAVRAVVVRGAGDRAFCAGGDVRALYEIGRSGDHEGALTFYRDEYRTDWRVARFPKPYISLIDGIVMGGGVGISVHGSHRVVSERALFAMPETGIGMFPDVGGTYFLPRCPGYLGTYLALSGARLKAADCLYAGIGTHHVPSGRLDALADALADADLGDDARAAVDAVIIRFVADPGPPPLAERRAAIDRCFGRGSVEEILQALDAQGDDWAQSTRAEILRKSPTSLKITFRQMREGATLDFDGAMRLEYRMVARVIAGHDFYEGVRALIIDKDNRPAWDPDSLGAVADEDVAAYFAPLPGSELELGWED